VDWDRGGDDRKNKRTKEKNTAEDIKNDLANLHHLQTNKREPRGKVESKMLTGHRREGEWKKGQEKNYRLLYI